MHAQVRVLDCAMETVTLHVRALVVVSVLAHAMRAVMDHALENARVDALLGVMTRALARVLQHVQEVLNNGYL